jgi:NAD(P)-dependent dehydrogenase (short-subunit alcohol dehydrogenase family)
MAFSSLMGHSALITGGAGGIGSASARWLLQDGAAVVLLGRSEETLGATADRLRAETSGDVRYVVGDAVSPDVIEAGIGLAETMGRFTMCVSVVNVTGGGQAPILAKSTAMFGREVLGSVMPPYVAIKHVAPAIVRAGGGAIVCISSTAGRMVMPFHAGYCTGKAGVEMLVRVAAEELGPLHVRVNALRPGLTHSKDTLIFSDPDILRQWVDEKPLGRYGEPDDIAAGVRYLVGPESSWLTGQSIAIDGGHELRKYQRADALVRQQIGDVAFGEAMAGRLTGSDPS